MTIKELINELSIDNDTIYAYFRHINQSINNEDEFQINDELYDNVKQNIFSFIKKDSFNPIKYVESKDETNSEQKGELLSYYKLKEKNILKEIKKHNQVDSLIFNGEFTPDTQGRGFGFFKKVNHESGVKLFYPIIEDRIDDIYIGTNGLIKGKRYLFLVQLARITEREKKNNPFLLQVKNDTAEEIILLTDAQHEISIKEQRLKVIREEVNKAESSLEQKTNEINDKLEGIRTKKENEIDVFIKQKDEELRSIIEDYNTKIEAKQKEFADKENNVATINSQINILESGLNEVKEKKSQMEATINFLRQKINTCKNLEFLSEEDGNKYLDILTTKPFALGDTHLDFEKDLSADFPALVTHIQNYLYHKKNLIYTEFQIKNFLSLLMTNDLIILSGLSGSGKTQIVKSFAEVLGGVAKIIPVKPNWTSSDDLLGYYNPIQSSFLPTPFTEAITEAIQNPNQIYLICLDEMNLARAEYYFADFLSKMEERSEQPEIDLYAKHEEELFISEFKTLLTLIESATDKKSISSWQEFLETDSIRNRFFELLGNTEKETLLQIHSKMKRRLLDILKFPATMKIPNNVRFIGAINVDETTHYFSPKILDRVHIVKFENPLLIEDQVNERIKVLAKIAIIERNRVYHEDGTSEISYMNDYEIEFEANAYIDELKSSLKPIHLNPIFLGNRQELPTLSSNEFITKNLKELNKDFLLPLSIDFGVRSIRQSINYALQFAKVSNLEKENDFLLNEVSALNAIINQKILPRFIFDGNEKLRTGETKTDLLNRLATYIKEKTSIIYDHNLGNYEVGFYSHEYLRSMITNDGQVNFYA